MNVWRRWVELFEEDPADEPRYDPVHLALVLVGVQVAVGVVFWLEWTAFVYEGGLMTGEGRLGNALALGGLALAAFALARLLKAPKRR